MPGPLFLQATGGLMGQVTAFAPLLTSHSLDTRANEKDPKQQWLEQRKEIDQASEV